MAGKPKQPPKQKASANQPQTYPKEQILRSIWYSHRRDLLSSLLEDGEAYTIAEVDQKIKQFSERKEA